MTHDNDLCTSDKNEAKREWRHPYVSIARGWSCCLVFIQCRIMSSFEQQLSLHVLLLSISLHHIYVNWVNNDNVHQSIKVVSSNKIIHSLSSMARERWKTFFYICVPLSKIIVVTISWSVLWGLMYVHFFKGIETNGYLNC
jgi:hypothetical protein